MVFKQMLMDTGNKRIIYLIDKITNGLASPEEVSELEIWYYAFDGDEKYTPSMTDQQKHLFKARLFNGIEKEVTSYIRQKPYPFIKYYRMFAAAVLLIIGSALFFYVKQSQQVASANVAQKYESENVLPGGNKATLTLANGNTIVLDDMADGKLAKIGNTNVTKTSGGEIKYTLNGSARDVVFNTLTTPEGGEFKLALPDGTRVWLNAGSSITYPSAFTGKKRSVSITGEAYFEVAKDAKMPFYVKTGKQEIIVLGTHFNVKAYSDENDITTTLLEGSVKVNPVIAQGSETVKSEVLKPGEQAVLKNSEIKVNTVDTDQATAWKNGYFHFEETDITEVMRQLARWYNVEVLYEGKIDKEKFFGKIKRTYSLNEVLSVLQTGDLHFRIKQGDDKNKRKKLIIIP
jgi:transmembrane sensor